jgi:hypothetical protein
MSVLSGIAVRHIFTDIWRTACQIGPPDLKNMTGAPRKCSFLAHRSFIWFSDQVGSIVPEISFFGEMWDKCGK